jgi:hypothetical protein
MDVHSTNTLSKGSEGFMSVDEKSVEQFAKSFHHYHEALASDFGCDASNNPDWQQLPSAEKKRLVAAVRLALMDTEASEPPAHPNVNIFTLLGEGTEGRECGC